MNELHASHYLYSFLNYKLFIYISINYWLKSDNETTCLTFLMSIPFKKDIVIYF